MKLQYAKKIEINTSKMHGKAIATLRRRLSLRQTKVGRVALDLVK